MFKVIANSIMSVHSRETDTVGRYGGEEFAVVLPDTDIAGGMMIANLLLERIRSLNIEHAGSHDHKIVTVSIGMSVLEVKSNKFSGQQLEDFVQHADDQLYEAKHQGKNCVCFDKCTNLPTHKSKV